MNRILALLIVFVFCLSPTIANSQSARLADQHWNKAQALNKSGEYLEAAKMYVKSAEAEQASQRPRMRELALTFQKAGEMYWQVGRYDKAIEHYQQALAIARRQGQEGFIANSLNNIGMVYRSWGQFDKAISHLQRALAIDRKLGREAGIATRLSNIGLVYHSWGQYDKAIDHFRQGLVIARRLGSEAERNQDLKGIEWTSTSIAGDLSNIGGVYHSWGQYDKAIDHFQQALVIARRLGTEAIAG
ncbi:MAG TPA: tetratricopeptide repeat protein, partial [Nitrospinaceae bacterium]|nr:tetratricopeptide repeat protein [Nitrospinaceae bacterium]